MGGAESTRVGRSERMPISPSPRYLCVTATLPTVQPTTTLLRSRVRCSLSSC